MILAQLVISVICIDSLPLNQKSHALQTPFISPFFLLREIIAQIFVKIGLKRIN
ncbi:hypothetical protein HMPREF1393_00394 [Helicobacter pylori GAM103Bi]|nr:hypothetical protein HMPREF1393_00394 [Helicobacter pylori GAM103Bi]